MMMIEQFCDYLLQSQKHPERIKSPEELVAEINSAIENMKAADSTLEPVFAVEV
jgi:hypothetical protein